MFVDGALTEEEKVESRSDRRSRGIDAGYLPGEFITSLFGRLPSYLNDAISL